MCLSISHFTVIRPNVPWTAWLLGRCFVCVCVWNGIRSADERWHDAKMTVSHKPMPGLIHLCVCWVWQRRKEDVTVTRCQSRTGWGFVFWKLTLPFHFSLLSSVHPSISPPPYPSHSICMLMGVTGDVNEGVGVGLGLPSYLSLYLSVCPSTLSYAVYLSVRIWIFVEDGCVVSTNQGLRLNLKCPLREPVQREEGMECG